MVEEVVKKLEFKDDLGIFVCGDYIILKSVIPNSTYKIKYCKTFFT